MIGECINPTGRRKLALELEVGDFSTVDADLRFAVARKIVEHAADPGIPAHDIVVDPLVMPVGAMATAGNQVFTLVRRLREENGVTRSATP